MSDFISVDKKTYKDLTKAYKKIHEQGPNNVDYGRNYKNSYKSNSFFDFEDLPNLAISIIVVGFAFFLARKFFDGIGVKKEKRNLFYVFGSLGSYVYLTKKKSPFAEPVVIASGAMAFDNFLDTL